MHGLKVVKANGHQDRCDIEFHYRSEYARRSSAKAKQYQAQDGEVLLPNYQQQPDHGKCQKAWNFTDALQKPNLLPREANYFNDIVVQ